jgi:hypothetical protein
MAATVTKLAARRRGASKTGALSVRTAVDAFLDSPKVAGNPNTLRAYTNVLDRVADRIEYEEIKTPLVPRVGELIDIDNRSYQVMDVLWHHYRKSDDSVRIVSPRPHRCRESRQCAESTHHPDCADDQERH